MGISTAARDMRPPIRESIIKGLDLTHEAADILVWLFGNAKLGWEDFKQHDDHFVSAVDLREAVVHEPAQFSRRLKNLHQKGYIETISSAGHTKGRRKYVQKVRITEKGITTIQPVFERYRRFASKILAGIPQEDLVVHCRVNNRISSVIKNFSRSVWDAFID